MTPRSILRFARWYVREITGASGYERYLTRHRSHAPGPPLSRREYERLRTDQLDRNPGARCC
ncbi:CstA-like transporter-associated (seleno)protein [Sphaerisporangium perillae]|uniref:CstA-like transporter-associated (seleno)protein n=1 Tax=Sphaerisporangium perillae TaxID=2935860 RepID=UPI00200C9B2B|nr:YbdD/YjiX family protein [Sphaerisporangium perillae]